MFELLYLILGLLGLLIGTELIINGSLNIAEHLKLSQLFIGLTVLAIGTDLPELFVIITGAVYKLGGADTSGLIIGNSIGSCFGQIALTLGVLGFFGTLTLTKRELRRDGLMLLGSVVLLFLVAYDGTITRIDGLIFVLFYLLYFYTLIREEKLHGKIKEAPKMFFLWAVVSLIAGFAILIYCSNLIIANAMDLAESLGIAQSLIGILIIGLGTSLPELAVSFGALRKNSVRLSVGNLIGSNIFDVLVPLGIGATIAGINVDKNLLFFDIPFLFVLSLIVLLFFKRKMRILKKEAIALIAIYCIYVILKIAGL